MKVAVDADRCRGHGICCAHSPQVFELTDDGYTVVLLPEPPPEYEKAVQRAVAQCPEHAITASP